MKKELIKRRGIWNQKLLNILKDRQQASVDELAAALGKESSKDFSSLVKTSPDGKKASDFALITRGGLELYEKKKQERLTLKGVFHAHKNGFGFVTLNEEVGWPLCRP